MHANFKKTIVIRKDLFKYVNAFSFFSAPSFFYQNSVGYFGILNHPVRLTHCRKSVAFYGDCQIKYKWPLSLKYLAGIKRLRAGRRLSLWYCARSNSFLVIFLFIRQSEIRQKTQLARSLARFIYSEMVQNCFLQPTSKRIGH